MATKPLSEFEQDISAVAALLAEKPAMQTFFNALTAGYQREWARFIFGTASDAAKQRHIATLLDVFNAGYKSKRAYDSRK